jgi:hypothetical protein
MSATILYKDAFCKSIGLSQNEVKFIQVESEFPIGNRPIIPLNIAKLNKWSLKQLDTQKKIAKAVDDLI